MAVVLTFDLRAAPPNFHNRIQSAFERLGWENLGGSAYRYPKLGTVDQPVEDWFNHVVPALMVFRSAVLKNNVNVTKFTLDVVSSSGWSAATAYGNPPRRPNDPNFAWYDPTNVQFGQANLEQWLEDVEQSYPY